MHEARLFQPPFTADFSRNKNKQELEFNFKSFDYRETICFESIIIEGKIKYQCKYFVRHSFIRDVNCERFFFPSLTFIVPIIF